MTEREGERGREREREESVRHVRTYVNVGVWGSEKAIVTDYWTQRSRNLSRTGAIDRWNDR